jgi:hypothetical protein
MLRRKNISRELWSEFRKVENRVTEDYAESAHSEEVVTGSLLSSLRRVNKEFYLGKDVINIDVDVKEAIDESDSGADIGIRYQFQTPKFSVSRGIIAQAKRYGTPHNDLPLQCLKMLLRTEEAYIFVYSESMIGVFPALPILLEEGKGGKFEKFYFSPFQWFMTNYIQGFHGEIPIADKIDQPSEAIPVEERARFIVDFKVSVSGIDSDVEFDFDEPNPDNYRRYISEQ